MAAFPVKVIKPGEVAGTFYVTPPHTKVRDGLSSAGITSVGFDEEILLNGKPVSLDEDLLPQDRLDVTKKVAPVTPVLTVLPKGSGSQKS